MFFLFISQLVVAQDSFTDKEVVEKATAYFKQFMDNPNFGPNFFGLKDSEEAENAELKNPLKFMSLNKKFIEDEVFSTTDDYLKFVEWFVPVFYGDEMRSFIL